MRQRNTQLNLTVEPSKRNMEILKKIIKNIPRRRSSLKRVKNKP